MRTDRILGYAPLEGLDGLLTVLNAVPGPAVEAWHGSRLAAVVQSEPDAPARDQPLSRITHAPTVQRRLELACHAGPFLPHDPGTAVIPSDAVPALLAMAWPALHTALLTHGNHHQWDVHLRWSPRCAINLPPPRIMLADGPHAHPAALGTALQAERARQEARLFNTLSRAVLALASNATGGSGTSVRITALIKAGAAHAMEAVLESLEEADLAIELEGPLPPLTFAPVSIATIAEAEIAGAWHVLELGDRTSRPDLQVQWCALAGSVGPDRQGHRLSGAAPGLAGLTDAYRLLRGLLPRDGSEASCAEVLAKAGRRLIVPDAPGAAALQTTLQLEPAQ